VSLSSRLESHNQVEEEGVPDTDAVDGTRFCGSGCMVEATDQAPDRKDRIFIELVTSDRKLKASREGRK